LGITSLRAWIVAGSLLSICAVSHAAGLGKLNVTSALGEPLKAEIELVAEKNEVGSLAARLASPDAFERAGLAYSKLMTSVKVSIEKRSGGEPYVLLTSTQPVTEPFVDLLVELTWSSGRISREFTALLDPPSVIAEREKQKAAAAEVRAAPAQPQPKAEPVPEPAAETPKPEVETPKPETASAAQPPIPAPAEPGPAPAPSAPEVSSVPSPPVETIGGSQPTLLNEGSALPSGTKAAPAADAYGPVRSGDTLGKIASATKPANVSLEQMLVLLVQNNPGAFSGKNMNRLKTGKILQLPTTDQLAGITEADARKEVKLQARDWRAYKEQLAAAAGQAAPAEQPAQQAASGKVGAAAEDQAASAKEPPREVLKLSKNEPAAGATGDPKAAARVHALEEEVVAREKAVKESNDRVAKLEKRISDLQALLEMKNKGMADLQKPAVVPPPATPQAPAQQSAPAQPAVPTAPAAATSPPPATPSPPGPKSESAPAPSQPAPVQPKPAPVKTAPVPAPEPSLINQVLDQPAYLGGAIGVLIIIGALAVRTVKRRRESKSDAEESGPAGAFAETSASAAVSVASNNAGASAEAATETSGEVDPVAEAEIFLAYGRDAQAEELLKEALESSPKRHEIRLKLLQIYANRKDTKSFEKVAHDLQQATGGAGEIWNQAVALGYHVDPENSRYAAGESAAGAAVVAGAAAAASAAAENVDFNIGSEDSTTTSTDIDLGGSGSQFDRTQSIDSAAQAAHDSAGSSESGALPAMNFNVDLPASGEPGPEPQVPHAASASGLDFDIDLNSLAAHSGDAASSQRGTEPAAGGGLDFDIGALSLDAPSEPKMESAGTALEIDLSGISLDLGTETAPAISPSGKDDHWYDVQTKFDLAKAYQEMGDKHGAREILKEVLQEGDDKQKTAAQSVLSSLDS
jgi:pilus assembly protein FimV